MASTRRRLLRPATQPVTHTTPPGVLVTGATGRVGRLVVDELLRAGVPVRALTRQPERAASPAGAEIVAGGPHDPRVARRAARRSRRRVPRLDRADGRRRVGHRTRLAAHTSAEARRVVYLSSPHRTPHPFFQQPNALRGATRRGRAPARRHRDSISSILRPGMFASNALHWWAPQIRSGDVVRWPYADAETAPVDERDIAAVAARALLDERHANADYVLTGPESLSQAAQVPRDRLTPSGGRSDSTSCRRMSSGAKRQAPGRPRSRTCCSLHGRPRSGTGVRDVRRRGHPRIAAADLLLSGRPTTPRHLPDPRPAPNLLPPDAIVAVASAARTVALARNFPHMADDATNDASALLLYDGSCGFCARSVQFVLRHEGARRTLRFASLQSPAGAEIRARHPDLNAIDSVIWYEPGVTARPRARPVARRAAGARLPRRGLASAGRARRDRSAFHSAIAYMTSLHVIATS